mmetsp:Transcript_8524/g.27340  ORF Transcript_8524/g.27340 Transcript_8524/m.27340 type:complete len:269 (+) Transcript_8524:152-958(+)
MTRLLLPLPVVVVTFEVSASASSSLAFFGSCGFNAKDSNFASNTFPVCCDAIKYPPVIWPLRCFNGTALVYSNFSPTPKTGCLPITPCPSTNSFPPFSSVISNRREINCTGSVIDSFSILTLYAYTNRCSLGELCSGIKLELAVTLTPFVTHVDLAFAGVFSNNAVLSFSVESTPIAASIRLSNARFASPFFTTKGFRNSFRMSRRSKWLAGLCFFSSSSSSSSPSSRVVADEDCPASGAVEDDDNDFSLSPSSFVVKDDEENCKLFR